MIFPPEDWAGSGPSIFLAGGITDCPDWQATVGDLIPDVVLLNPRCGGFRVGDAAAEENQIAWEFRHLDRASVILFWFPAGPALQPTAQYELGRHAALGRTIAVGVDPGYPRAPHVRRQMRHARPDVEVHGSLCAVCEQAVRLVGSVVPA